MFNQEQGDRPTPPRLMAQQPSIPLDGQTVYVQRNDDWQAAVLTGWRWSSRAGERYTVLYLDDQQTEANVSTDRIRTAAAAEQAGQVTRIEDLSSPAGVEQMLAAHNTWRQQVGVPALTWSPELAAYAQAWAVQLLRENQFEHRADSLYGENLAASSGRQLSPAEVVDLWGREQQDYDYASNQCQLGKVCGHYTQVVWRDTSRVGCGLARNSQREVWVCNYDPPGNYVGRKPY
ncbi:MAG: hypothetical protein HC910_19370 [Spirulinaceae cyanobacterium SM2_1_0]|nr:hypothetical protein [Spirulinaceae cyanobacterium SM2_1_0]